MHPKMYLAFLHDHYDRNVIWNIVWCFVYFRFSKCRFIPIQLFHCTVQRKFTRAFCFYKTCFWQLLLINSLMWFIAILQISQKLIFYTFIDEICTRYIQLMWIYLFTWKNHTLCNYNWFKPMIKEMCVIIFWYVHML